MASAPERTELEGTLPKRNKRSPEDAQHGPMNRQPGKQETTG